jgi:DNA-binding beta-propeller fold protein YncE
MRLSFLALSFLPISFFGPDKPDKYPPIEDYFGLHWSANMGSASFRTNVVLTNNNLIIGSNGSDFMDFYISDKKSGVYTINRKTGAILNHFANEPLGDMDVNGLLLYNSRLYFGNDNEEFLCTSLDGKIIWRNPASGDMEHEPVLITNAGVNQIVYATETGEVKAVDPATGKAFWSYYVPEFDGWKNGDTRALFKVKSYFTNTYAFFTKPIIIDLTKDGVLDLVYHTYDGRFFAINGASGKNLWIHDAGNGTEIAMFQMGSNASPSITFFAKTFDEKFNATSHLVALNSAGKQIFKFDLSASTFGIGLNALSIGNSFIAQRDSLLEIDSKGNYKAYDRSNLYNDVDYYGKNTIEQRNGYESLISNRTFSYKGDNNCIVILNQHDFANYENGFIEIFSLTNHKVVARFGLPKSSEFPPMIADINKDGYLDLLINCHDGYLYCYDLKVKP